MTADNADEVTITVSRDDIERALFCARHYNSLHHGAADRIQAAVSSAEWEPTQAQIDAYSAVCGLSVHGTAISTRSIIGTLKTLHSAGLRLP